MGDRKKKRDHRPYRDYLRYSGIAFQVGAIVFLGVIGGRKLDAYLNMDAPVFTLVLTLGALAFALYYMFKELTK